MIERYEYGTPIPTDAAVLSVEKQTKSNPYVQMNESTFTFSYTLGRKDIVYGLGENLRGINKRGWQYESFASDDPCHREDKLSLYGAHNFIVIDGQEKLGFFFNYPGRILFDIGYSKSSELKVTASDMNLDLYVIYGDTVPQIVKEFRTLIGQSYIPPKWAFGYGQSRWGYENENEVREVVSKYRKNHIPIDSIYLDINYMERYKDFTVDSEYFPELKEFAEEMKEQHIHLVPIIDAGVKIEKGYSVYEEGVAGNYFCKNEDGSNFIGGVWPGDVHLPDVLNDKARRWFGLNYKFLLDQGIEGFWNDMNEPALFYSNVHKKEVFKEIKSYENKELDIQEYFKFLGLVNGISNRKQDYESFYHNMNGKLVRHDKVHNLYGYGMTRAAAEAFEELVPEKRILIFSRASYIGMHRYGGIWTGDNMSWWSHLLLNIKMMPSLNMCGFIYSGADLGGFGADTTEDLLLRWMEFGIFTPLMRNHSAMGTRRQEVYLFEETEAFRNIIGLRYGLLPYLYSEFMKAVLRNEMYFRPLAFDYLNDDRAKGVEDQLLLGDSIMIAPVYEQNAQGRYVYLPEDMKLVRFRSLSDYDCEILKQGDHYIPIGLEEVVLFIRQGKLLPLADGAEWIGNDSISKLSILAFGDNASYEWYDDDGIQKYDEKRSIIRTITVADGKASCDDLYVVVSIIR